MRRAGRELAEWRDFDGAVAPRSVRSRRRAARACSRACTDWRRSPTSPTSTRDPLYVDTVPVRELSHDIEHRRASAWRSRRVGSARHRAGAEQERQARPPWPRARRTDRGPRAMWCGPRYEALMSELRRVPARRRLRPGGAAARRASRGVVDGYEALKQRAGALDFVDLLLRARDLLADHPRVRRRSRRASRTSSSTSSRTPIRCRPRFSCCWPRTIRRRATGVASRPCPASCSSSATRSRRSTASGGPTWRPIGKCASCCEARGAQRAFLHTSFRAAPAIQRIGERRVRAADDRRPRDAAGRSTWRCRRIASDAADQPSVVALPVPEPYGQRRVAGYAIEKSLPDARRRVRPLAARRRANGRSPSGRCATSCRYAVPIEPRHVCILFRRFLQFRRGRHARRTSTPSRRAAFRTCWSAASRFTIAKRSRRSARRSPRSSGRTTSCRCLRRCAARCSRSTTRRCSSIAIVHTGVPSVPRAATSVARRSVSAGRRRACACCGSCTAGATTGRWPTRSRGCSNATRAHVGFVLRPAGEQALANVLHVAELARQYEVERRHVVPRVRRRAREQADGGQAAEAPILEEGSDGVRLMTVHKAKGLEFPVVILADMTAKLRNERADRSIDRAQQRVLSAARSLDADRARRPTRPLEVARDEAEGVRVAYVAATRARDLLVVPAVGDVPWDGGWTGPLNGADVPESPARGGRPNDLRGARLQEGFGLADDRTTRPATPLTVCPGEHGFAGADRTVFGGLVGSACARAWRRAVDRHPAGTLIMKDVPAVGGRRRAARSTRSGARHARSRSPEVRDRRCRCERRRNGPLRRRRRPQLESRPASPTCQKRGGIVRTARAVRRAAPRPDAATPTDRERGLGRRWWTRAVECVPAVVRFGELVHAMLAAVPLDAERSTIEALADVQGRILSAPDEEVAAAVDIVRAGARARADRPRACCRAARIRAVVRRRSRTAARRCACRGHRGPRVRGARPVDGG